MTTKVYVTPAQVEAAQLTVERNATRGLPTPPEVLAIAKAKPAQLDGVEAPREADFQTRQTR